MGNASSNSVSPEAGPEGIEQLNDSVWELKQPDGPHEIDIIFLQLSRDDLEAAFWKTWLSRDGTVVWPKDWLGATFPNARIWSISYNGLANRDSQIRLEQLNENLLQNIITFRNCSFDGHSLGGIIIKSLILKCIHKKALLEQQNDRTLQQNDTINRINQFWGNCRGVFFYSSPFGGSTLADFLRTIPERNMPLVRLLKVLNESTNAINEDLGPIRHRMALNIHTYAVCEDRDTTYMGFRGKVVEEASARRDMDDFYTASGANHIEVCKARNKVDSIYAKLTAFISDTCMHGTLIERTRQTAIEQENLC